MGRWCRESPAWGEPGDVTSWGQGQQAPRPGPRVTGQDQRREAWARSSVHGLVPPLGVWEHPCPQAKSSLANGAHCCPQEDIEGQARGSYRATRTYHWALTATGSIPCMSPRRWEIGHEPASEGQVDGSVDPDTQTGDLSSSGCHPWVISQEKSGGAAPEGPTEGGFEASAKLGEGWHSEAETGLLQVQGSAAERDPA